MLVILPVNSTVRALPMVMLLILMFVLGVFLAYPGTLLVLAPRLLVVFDFVGIPAGLLAGWIVFRLGRQLFKSRMDDHGGGLFSSVGFSAWVIFLMVSNFLAGGMWLGGWVALDTKAHPPFEGRVTRRVPVRNSTSGNTAIGNSATGHGRIFFGTAAASTTNSVQHP